MQNGTAKSRAPRMNNVSILQDCLADWRARSGAPGVSAAVRLDGRLVWASSADDGVLAGAARVPIYSITKTLTAICVLRLHEIGSLNVADPARRWLPEVAVSDTITLAHLLRHTSGLKDYGPLPEYHAAVRSRRGDPWTEQQFLDVAVLSGTHFEPGQSWAYSNVGYMMLRLVLQRVTGRSFAQVVRELVVSPLELQHTFVAERIEDWSTCVPGHGPEIDPDGRVVDVRGVYHPGWCAPGVMVSNAEEVTLVFDALFAGRLLKPETLTAMLTLVRVPGEHPPAVTPSCGMGILADASSPRGRHYGHGGGGPGYDLWASILPDTALGRLSIATFVNTSCGPRAQDCEEQLLSRLLDAR
jgi:D-alanyl-D-alanine carboxypeptidase